MIKTLDFTALLCYCLFIYWLSDQAHLPAPMWFSNQDKVHHFLAYFVMGILAWRYFRHFLQSPYILAIAITGFCSIYGISDEWHQAFTPGRQSDIRDWLADSIGGGLATLATILLKPIKHLSLFAQRSHT